MLIYHHLEDYLINIALDAILPLLASRMDSQSSMLILGSYVLPGRAIRSKEVLSVPAFLSPKG